MSVAPASYALSHLDALNERATFVMMMELTGESRACIPIGLTNKMVWLTEQSEFEKSRPENKKSFIGPG